jgi:hypothetical protein
LNDLIRLDLSFEKVRYRGCVQLSRLALVDCVRDDAPAPAKSVPQTWKSLQTLATESEREVHRAEFSRFDALREIEGAIDQFTFCFLLQLPVGLADGPASENQGVDHLIDDRRPHPPFSMTDIAHAMARYKMVFPGLHWPMSTRKSMRRKSEWPRSAPLGLHTECPLYIIRKTYG